MFLRPLIVLLLIFSLFSSLSFAGSIPGTGDYSGCTIVQASCMPFMPETRPPYYWTHGEGNCVPGRSYFVEYACPYDPCEGNSMEIQYSEDYGDCFQSNGCITQPVDMQVCVDLYGYPPGTDPATCSDGTKTEGEDGVDCGGSCSDECIKSCPTGEKLFKTSDADIYYCATVTAPDSNGVCTSGIPNASGTQCHKIDFSGLLISDQDYIDSINNSTDSSDSPVSDGAYNYLDSNPATSNTSTTTQTTTNPDGSTTITKTEKTTKSNGSTSTTTTKTTTNADGSTTVSKTTVNYDADGNITGTSSSSGTTGADGNSSSGSTSSDGDEADGGDGGDVVAGDGAEDLDISEDIDLTYGSFGTAWDGFRDQLATTTLIASVQAFTNAIPTQSTGPIYTMEFGSYGSHSIDTGDYDQQLEIIGYALLIMSSFIGIRIILTGK